MRDYVKIAKQYARKAVADKKHKRHGLLLRQAAQRFLDDLKRARSKDCAFRFDPWHANDACDFIEKLPHVEGVWETPDIVLDPSHIFFIVQLFGFRNRTGGRRYTSALLAVARKNAKSTVSAAILLYCQCCEDEPGAQILSAATTFDQAAIIFKVAKKMVEKTPDLAEAFGLRTWSKSITRFDTGASFKPIHAKASTQDGLNPSHVGLDEIHAHKNSELVNVLTSAAGARFNPLWLYTTTEGYVNAGPWSDMRRFAKQLLQGVFKHSADHFLVVMYAVDEENKTLGIKADDDFDESAWVKANPLIEANPYLLAAIRKEAIEAKHMPSKLAEFRIKRLNRSASTSSGWIELTRWQACANPVDLEWLSQYPCWGGLDLASTTDIAALRLVWNVEGILYTAGWRWVPMDEVSKRSARGTVPYASWVEQGLISQTEGNVTDYTVIEQVILELRDRFQIKQIGFDPWNGADLANRLADEGIELVRFEQLAKYFHPAMQTLERAYMSGRLVHGGDPVLEWCASNLIAKRDTNLNMKPDRKRSADKIDDMVALLIAIGIATTPEEDDERDLDGYVDNPIMVGL